MRCSIKNGSLLSFSLTWQSNMWLFTCIKAPLKTKWTENVWPFSDRSGHQPAHVLHGDISQTNRVSIWISLSYHMIMGMGRLVWAVRCRLTYSDYQEGENLHVACQHVGTCNAFPNKTVNGRQPSWSLRVESFVLLCLHQLLTSQFQKKKMTSQDPTIVSIIKGILSSSTRKHHYFWG